MKLHKLLLIIGIIFLFYSGFHIFFQKKIEIEIENDLSMFEKQKKNLFDHNVIRADFERVIDGDTIIVTLDNSRERVRLIGVDTPESVKPNTPVECFGKEASDFLKRELKNQKYVYLEFDHEAGNYDKNGRILAHVFNKEAENINQKIIAEGYGYEYTYKRQEYLHKDDYKQAQIQAQNKKRGLWSDEICN